MAKLAFISPLIFVFCFVDAHQKAFYNNRDTLPKVIIINAFDASPLHVRKNKRQLFEELTDSLKVYLQKEIKIRSGSEAIINSGLAKQITDSTVRSLMVANHVNQAIVIRSLEVYFNEAGETHREEYGLSPKTETKYDLCSKIDYAFYNADFTSKESQVNKCDYFTTRSVNDSKFVIQFGPDIVGKKKHTYGTIEKNAENYISSIASLLQTEASQ